MEDPQLPQQTAPAGYYEDSFQAQALAQAQAPAIAPQAEEPFDAVDGGTEHLGQRDADDLVRSNMLQLCCFPCSCIKGLEAKGTAL